jgi:hypothetical protein
MKTPPRRRPEFESLESMLLLSTLTQPIPAAAASGPPQQLTLTGTLHLTGSQHKAQRSHGQAIPASFEATGSGNVSGLGHVKVALITLPGNPGYILALGNKHTALSLITQTSLSGDGSPTTAEYGVVDGEGAVPRSLNYLGNITATETVLKGGKSAITIKLS